MRDAGFMAHIEDRDPTRCGHFENFIEMIAYQGEDTIDPEALDRIDKQLGAAWHNADATIWRHRSTSRCPRAPLTFVRMRYAVRLRSAGGTQPPRAPLS